MVLHTKRQYNKMKNFKHRLSDFWRHWQFEKVLYIIITMAREECNKAKLCWYESFRDCRYSGHAFYFAFAKEFQCSSSSIDYFSAPQKCRFWSKMIPPRAQLIIYSTIRPWYNADSMMQDECRLDIDDGDDELITILKQPLFSITPSLPPHISQLTRPVPVTSLLPVWKFLIIDYFTGRTRRRHQIPRRQ